MNSSTTDIYVFDVNLGTYTSSTESFKYMLGSIYQKAVTGSRIQILLSVFCEGPQTNILILNQVQFYSDTLLTDITRNNSNFTQQYGNYRKVNQIYSWDNGRSLIYSDSQLINYFKDVED